MDWRLLPLAALSLLPASAPALPCPPPVWWGPPVVWVYAPPRPVVWIDPCWCPPVSYAVPTPAVPPAAARAAEPAAPKASPRVDDTPAVKPVVPAADTGKPADTPTMPPLTLPITPPVTPAPKPATPEPTAPKGLDLKPANPGVPEVPPLNLPLPPKEMKTSYSSPLATTLSVRLVPAAGPAPAADAPRRVVFVNLSRSDVVLTVAGESAVLPARHEVTATVPASFKWRVNGGEVRTADLTAAPGADVVIR